MGPRMQRSYLTEEQVRSGGDRTLPLQEIPGIEARQGGLTGARLPSIVTVRGRLAAQPSGFAAPAVAIVGARVALRSGLEFAGLLAGRMAQAGWLVVSGGAYGVDAAAHEGALAARGVSIAVLGTGVDQVYPERHADLFARICIDGALVSQFPYGLTAKAGVFPTRNPVIAALADAVVVVEAGARSGSLGTAAAARRLGRALYARPGSAGCDTLITSGAAEIAVDVDTLVAALLGQPAPAPIALCDEAEQVLLAFGRAPLSAEDIATSTRLTLGEVHAGLCELELSRRTIRLDDGRYLALPGTADLKE